MSVFSPHCWLPCFVVASILATNSSTVIADEADDVVYFSVDLDELIAELEPDDIVAEPGIPRIAFYQADSTPRVVVPSDCEAYLLRPDGQAGEENQGSHIIGRKSAGQAIEGFVYVLQSKDQPERMPVLAKLPFSVAPNPAVPSSSAIFHRARGLHYQRLWSEGMAGSALFRHYTTESMKSAGLQARNTGPNWRRGRINNNSVEGTIRLTSGGRAISENLQLDRELNADAEQAGQREQLSDIEGVTIPEINWKPLLRDEPTELDALAHLIPEDQYAVFLPNFASALKLIDQGQSLAKPMVQWFEPASRRTDVADFYQHQLGLPINFVTRQLGGQLIDEIALTGSDPYFRTGTDLAVLLKSNSATTLHASLKTQIVTSAIQDDLTQSTIRIAGRTVFANVTTDRRISSYLVRVDDTVIVSNSLAQVERILSTADEETASMGVLDEYKFFRQRYQKNNRDETALVIVTDAAIRKWCGPKWRISASRRTLARAVLADQTAVHLESLLDGDSPQSAIEPDASVYDAGRMTLTSRAVVSDTFGTMQFQTPILEMDLRTATKSEVDRYGVWRNRYQRRWRGTFDPIAIQVSMDDQSLAADLSVLPLILGSDYRTFQDMVGENRLPAETLAPTDAMFSFESALDFDARQWSFARSIIAGNIEFDPFSWIDDGMVLYAMPNKAWDKRLANRDPWDLSGDDVLMDLPIAIHLPSKNNFKMTAFVVAVRAMIDQFAPNMIQWTNTKVDGTTYVSGQPRGSTPLGNADELPGIHYVTTPQGWTISFNQDVIRSAIKSKAKPREKDPSTPKSGPQLRFKATGQALKKSAQANPNNGVRRMCELAWNNIPILNELRHRYPDRDPIAVYSQVFDQQLIDPAGGQYVWNESLQTYESTLYGHHLAPKAGPAISPEIGAEDTVRTELTFQDNGLRAKLRWNRADAE